MTGIGGAVRDPFVVSVWLLAGVIASGFAAFAVAWRGAAATTVAGDQVPFVVSGGLGGFGLLGFGTGVLVIQLRRRAAALRRHALDRAITAATDAVAAAGAVSDRGAPLDRGAPR